MVVGVANGIATSPPRAGRCGERAVAWDRGQHHRPYARLRGQTSKLAALVRQRKGDDDAGPARSGGAPRAVQILLGPVRRVGVKNQTHLVDVDAARGNVGGHEHRE